MKIKTGVATTVEETATWETKFKPGDALKTNGGPEKPGDVIMASVLAASRHTGLVN